MLQSKAISDVAMQNERQTKGGKRMRGIPKRAVLTAWALVFGVAGCLIFAILFSKIWWAGVALCLGGYAFVGARYLRCPHCGAGETLDRLTRALVQEYHCSRCGERITLE